MRKMSLIQKMLRTLAAILVALFVAFILVVAVEFFSAVVHPPPQDFGGTMEETCRHVENYPAWVLAVVVPAWALIAFVSVFAARKIGNLFSAAFVGLFLLAAVAFNVSMLPYPIWFKIVILAAIPTFLLAGGRLAARGSRCRQSPEPINFA